MTSKYTSALIEPHYFPSVLWFRQVYPFRGLELQLEMHSKYYKQTFQNRCYITTSQGMHQLVVPVQHTSSTTLYKEVKIDYTTPWVKQHIRSLATAYGQTPYYPAFADRLIPILTAKYCYLYDVTSAILQLCLDFLQLSPQISTTTAYIPHHDKTTLDLRQTLHPKIENTLQDNIPPYPQRFGVCRDPRVSMLDPLCALGPHAYAILQ